MSVSSSIPSRSGRTKKHLVFQPAPVMARFVAALADLLLIVLFTGAVSGAWAVGVGTSPVRAAVVAVLAAIVVREAILARAGITPGMAVMRIRMVNRFTGGRPGLRALVHSTITAGVTCLSVGIGAIILFRSMLRDAHRVGWHDHMSDIRVISTSASIPRAAQRPVSPSRAAPPAAAPAFDTSTSSHQRGQVIIDSVPWSRAPVPVDPPAGNTCRSSSIVSPSFAAPQPVFDSADRDDVLVDEVGAPQAPATDGGIPSAPSVDSTGELPVIDTDAVTETPPEKIADSAGGEPPHDRPESHSPDDVLLPEPVEDPRTEVFEISHEAAIRLAAAEGSGETPTIRLIPLTGGEPLTISTVTVVGRQPENISEVAQAQLCAIHDDARSVSKTHALLIPAETSLWVMDLHSTNGTYITINGTTKRVESMLPAPQGAVIAMGRASFRVE